MADRPGSASTRAAAPFLAGLLVLGLVACSATPAISPSATASAPPPTAAPTTVPTASPEATTEPQTAPPASLAGSACTAADLKASHDLVEGAAGSRATTVALVAATPCSIDLFPAMGIRDADGTELVASTTTGSGRIDLDPSRSYESLVRFANWCNPEPKYPLTLVIRIGTEEVGVTGSSFPDAGDMPPCNGGGGPTLDAGQWEAAP